MNLREALDQLNRIYESYSPEINPTIDLTKCRNIESDVYDSTGNIESSACLDYYPNGCSDPVLTRVAAYVFVVKETAEGFMFLAKARKHRLPGGGYDINKDSGDLANTVYRETLEETGIKIKDIKDANYSNWRFEQNNGFESGWVNKHIEKEEDRHHGYYAKYYIAKFDSVVTETAEETDRFSWWPITVAQKSVSVNKILYDAATEAGYLNPTLTEDIELTEEKQVGLVSYCIRNSKDLYSINVLEQILKTNFIKASAADKATWPQAPYVSLSRDLTSHIGSTWTNGIILDGTKLSNKYKIEPIDHNSLIYLADARSNKTLELKAVAKYENELDPSKCYYRAFIAGNSFKPTIDEKTYNALKHLMKLYNKHDAVKTERGNSKYYDKQADEVKRYTTKHPIGFNPTKKGDDKGIKVQQRNVPPQFRDEAGDWYCKEAIGYNVRNSGLLLTNKFLSAYRDKLLVDNGVDVSERSFIASVVGSKYYNEAEERAVAQIKKFVDENGTEDSTENSEFGLDITGCIKGIMINRKYKPIIESGFIEPYYLGDERTGEATKKVETNKATINALKSIISIAGNIPIVYVYEDMNNAAVLRQL